MLKKLKNSDRFKDSDYKKVVEFATKLEGTIRHASTHATGVIISQDNLTNDVPLQRSTSGEDDSLRLLNMLWEL